MTHVIKVYFNKVRTKRFSLWKEDVTFAPKIQSPKWTWFSELSCVIWTQDTWPSAASCTCFLSSSTVTWIQNAFKHLTFDRRAVYVEQKIYCQSSLSGTLKDIMTYFVEFWPFGLVFFPWIRMTYGCYADMCFCVCECEHAVEETISLIALFVFLFHKQMCFYGLMMRETDAKWGVHSNCCINSDTKKITGRFIGSLTKAYLKYLTINFCKLFSGACFVSWWSLLSVAIRKLICSNFETLRTSCFSSIQLNQSAHLFSPKHSLTLLKKN